MRSREAFRERLTGGAPALPLLVLFGLNAVDELDRAAFGVLLPEIRDHFGLDVQGMLTVVSLTAVAVLFIEIPIAFYADRGRRVRIATIGALAWGCFSLLTGLAPTLLVLAAARVGSGIGRSVNTPTHTSLLSDYYGVGVRANVFGTWRAGNSLGQFLGPITAGLLAHWFGWRLPFLVFGVPTLVFLILATRLREPTRGRHERTAAGATDETVVETEETPPSFAESWRIAWQVNTLRRIWLSLPFLAAALVGLVFLLSIFYEDVFGLNEAQRGFLIAGTEAAQIVGIVVGIPLANRLFATDPGRALRFIAVDGVIVAGLWTILTQAPNLPVAIAAHALLAAFLAILAPAIYAALSLTIPPRVRSLGFSIGSLWMVPGALILIIVGGLTDSLGVRQGLLFMVPMFLIGAFVIASAGSFVASDIAKVRASTVAQAEVLAARREGRSKLLLVKDLEVGYDGIQVLFGVNLEVDEGEIVALLGTNGAGKTTLLNAISGLVEPSAGAIVFDGVDATYTPANEMAARGVVQAPGGKGAFPNLTVEENLKLAGWLYQKDPAYLEHATEQVLTFFPVLRERMDQAAGSLSGGEQQMLTLGQAFIARPRLLMIDELSLGLAPIVVEQLLQIVRAIRDRGTTIVLIEQSVNVALTLAETAYFMEKGEVRFHGKTRDLLERPDILRSVFLEGADAAIGNGRPRAKRAPQGRNKRGEARAVLSIRSVSRHYGGIAAVDGVSIDLKPGEILGIVGPNGAGKTTLFDLVSGFVEPDDGQVVLGERDITSLDPHARAALGLGRSFQGAKLFSSLTVYESLAVALERHTAVRDPVACTLRLWAAVQSEADVATRVEQVLTDFGLQRYRDAFIPELSTGTRRVVELACAVIHEPSVLLLDEPSSGIAQRETEALAPLLRQIAATTGASLLVIEHDMPLITAVADRLVAMDLGRVIAQGESGDVIGHPDVVRAYLGGDENVIKRSGNVGPKRRPSKTGGRRKAANARDGSR